MLMRLVHGPCLSKIYVILFFNRIPV